MTPDEINVNSEEKKIKKTASQIEPGDIFNHWKVIKFDHINKHRIKYFLCRCMVCGNVRSIRGNDLIYGISKACSKECTDSLIGQRFGRWTVLSVDKSKKRRTHYMCKCDCGTIKSVCKSILKNGQSKSCGCLKRDLTKQRNKENAENRVGQKMGRLTLLEPILKEHKDGRKGYYYRCKCDCGNEVVVKWQNLQSGNTVSCGCINSKANELMAKILTSYNIPFKREYGFDDCRDKLPLPFDFALFNKEDELIGLIENNGSLHYSTSGTAWDTPERLIYQQKHDYIKRKFCEDNNIPFLIIPYQYFNDIEKFLTSSDFWQIIIKNFND